jgi:hypothetical protein
MCAIADGPALEEKTWKVVPFVGGQPITPSWQDCLEKLKCLRTKHGSRIRMYIRRAVDLVDDAAVRRHLLEVLSTMKVSAAGPPKKRALEVLLRWKLEHNQLELPSARGGALGAMAPATGLGGSEFTIPKKKKFTLVFHKSEQSTKPALTIRMKRDSDASGRSIKNPPCPPLSSYRRLASFAGFVVVGW